MMNLLLIFLLLSCAQIHRIGLKEHSFSEQPRKIIWIQIAGFDINHLGILKFTNWNESRGEEFNNFICNGNLWQYDLYNLRPSASASMYAQVTGRNNSTGKCEDYNQIPYWQILNKEKGFDFYLIEQNPNKNESILSGSSCPENNNWLRSGVILSRTGEKRENKEEYFHYSETKKLEKNKIYYDRSCKSKNCYSSLFQVLNSLLERNLKNESKFVVHIRDFSYLRNLESGNLKEAAINLQDIERVHQLFNEKYSKEEFLFLITGASGRSLDFPNEGKDWKLFEKSTNKLNSKTTLIAPVLSSGARSENFCGIYNQSEVFNRLFFIKKKYKIGIGY